MQFVSKELRKISSSYRDIPIEVITMSIDAMSTMSKNMVNVQIFEFCL